MPLEIDTSKAPAPLPIPRLTRVSPGVSLLLPLSRKGTGPGLIILIPDSNEKLAIKNGVPSLLRKWAEEGYTVCAILESAFEGENVEELLKKARSALSRCMECEPKGPIGLIGKCTSC